MCGRKNKTSRVSNEKLKKQVTKNIKTEARNLVIKPLSKKKVEVKEKKIM